MKRVYICAPLGGNVRENLERVRRYARYALLCGMAPVVPHFYALCLDDNVPEERALGMAAGQSLLWLCDELWVFGNEVTEEMAAELRLCQSLHIPVQKIREKEIGKGLGEQRL